MHNLEVFLVTIVVLNDQIFFVYIDKIITNNN